MEQVLPWMEASRHWGLDKPCAHVIDRESDSVKHFRRWDAADHWFLVRADDRRVMFRDQSRLLSQIVAVLEQEQPLTLAGEVSLLGRSGHQWIADTGVLLHRPGWGRTAAVKTCRLPGAALRLRLVVVQVRDDAGQRLATWWLLTNVWEVTALQIAQRYYWRWRIESFHKLLKFAGLEMEEWLQETAGAIAKRLLVACMACVTVWALQREQTPAAQECQRFLVRLSGRQMKRKRPVTTPALLAGLYLLLRMLDVLEDYTPAQLGAYPHRAAPLLRPSG